MKKPPESNYLYTIMVSFDDFTQGLEQYEAPSPEAAMARFIREAQCLQQFPLGNRHLINGRDIKLLQIANLHGVWMWLPAQSNLPTMASVLGGQVIQTDRQARPRPK